MFPVLPLLSVLPLCLGCSSIINFEGCTWWSLDDGVNGRLCELQLYTLKYDGCDLSTLTSIVTISMSPGQAHFYIPTGLSLPNLIASEECTHEVEVFIPSGDTLEWVVVDQAWKVVLHSKTSYNSTISGLCPDVSYTFLPQSYSFVYYLSVGKVVYTSHAGDPKALRVGIRFGQDSAVCIDSRLGCCDECCLTHIGLELHTFSEDTNWKLTNTTGHVIHSGTSHRVLELCHGTYEFIIRSSSLCCTDGSGSYTLAVEDDVFFSSGGDFRDCEIVKFTVEGESAASATLIGRDSSCDNIVHISITGDAEFDWKMWTARKSLSKDLGSNTARVMTFYDFCPDVYSFNFHGRSHTLLIDVNGRTLFHSDVNTETVMFRIDHTGEASSIKQTHPWVIILSIMFSLVGLICALLCYWVFAWNPEHRPVVYVGPVPRADLGDAIEADGYVLMPQNGLEFNHSRESSVSSITSCEYKPRVVREATASQTGIL